MKALGNLLTVCMCVDSYSCSNHRLYVVDAWVGKTMCVYTVITKYVIFTVYSNVSDMQPRIMLCTIQSWGCILLYPLSLFTNFAASWEIFSCTILFRPKRSMLTASAFRHSYFQPGTGTFRYRTDLLLPVPDWRRHRQFFHSGTGLIGCRKV